MEEVLEGDERNSIKFQRMMKGEGMQTTGSYGLR